MKTHNKDRENQWKIHKHQGRWSAMDKLLKPFLKTVAKVWILLKDWGFRWSGFLWRWWLCLLILSDGSTLWTWIGRPVCFEADRKISGNQRLEQAFLLCVVWGLNSRDWLMSSVTTSQDAFFKDFMDNMYEKGCSDVTAGCTLRRHGITVEQMKDPSGKGAGLHGWNIKGDIVPGSLLNSGQLESIERTDPLPVVFHYLNDALVRAFHEKFKANEAHAGSNLVLKKTGSTSGRATFEAQMQCYISKLNSARVTNASFVQTEEAIIC